MAGTTQEVYESGTAHWLIDSVCSSESRLFQIQKIQGSVSTDDSTRGISCIEIQEVSREACPEKDKLMEDARENFP